MMYHILMLVIVFGVMLYTASVAQCLRVISDHHLKFQPEDTTQGALAAVGLLPGEVVQVKIGSENLTALLVSEGEGIELLPCHVSDIVDFEQAKTHLRAS